VLLGAHAFLSARGQAAGDQLVDDSDFRKSARLAGFSAIRRTM
jgi:hypothetical protein